MTNRFIRPSHPSAKLRGAPALAVCVAVLLWPLWGYGQPGSLPGGGGRHKDQDQQPKHQAEQKENRFLFVVDTSSSMHADSLYVRDSVLDLLKSGMQGQLREGDTIGLWNYDDQLHTEFPMQVWATNKSPLICERTASYLTEREYHKKAHLEKVLPLIHQLIQTSRRITVVFIYDGSQPMHGTPFDKDINDLQKQFMHDVRAADLPFVTILAARDGKVTEYTVNVPNSVVVPHTAEPPQEPETNAPPAVAVQTNVPPPVAPVPPAPAHFQIVMAGPHAHHASGAPTDIPSAPPPQAQDSTTPAPSGVQLVPIPPSPPANSEQVAAADNSSGGPAPPANPSAANPPPVPVPPGVSQVVTTTDGWNLIVRNPPPVAGQTAQNIQASGAGSPTVPNTAPPVSSAASGKPPQPLAAKQTAQSSPPVAQSAPQPAVPTADHPVAKPESGAESDGSTNAREASGRSPVGPIAAGAVTAASTGDHIALLIIAVSLLTIAIVLVLFLMRRSRGAPQPSFISQSIDRPR